MGRASTILINAVLINLAFFVFGGWAAFVVVFMPYISLPVSLISGAIVYAMLEKFGALLKARESLTLVNILACCSLVSLPLGFLPSRIVEGQNYPSRLNILFEDYAFSLLFYSVLLHSMAIAWWLSIRRNGDSAS